MKKREQGILTVEASIVLTLMLLFILFLFSFGRVYRAQNLVSHATLQSADAVALESYLRETALQSDVSEVVHLASHITESSAISAESLESLRSANLPKIARQKFIAAIASSEAKADEKLKSMGVKNGLAGVDFSECKMDLGNDDVIIAVKYTIEMQFPVFGFNEITVTKAAKAKTFGEILFEVSTKPNNPGWGSTSGDDKVVHGSTVQIEATPNYGYKFVSWDDGNTDNPRTVTVTDAQSYTAIFERDSFGINISKQIRCNEDFRKINHTDYGTFTGQGTYLYLENVVLTAKPTPKAPNTEESNYQFDGWDLNGDGIIDDKNATITVTVDKNYDNIKAVFKPALKTVKVKANNDSYGNVSATQGSKSNTTIQVEYGSELQLSASAKSIKYRFEKWSNNNTNSSISVTIYDDVEYVANFASNTYTVSFYNGSTFITSTQVIRNSSIKGSKTLITSSIPGNPSSNGVSFKQWIYNGSQFTEETPVNSDIKVYAKYQYTVKFTDSNGNKLRDPITKDVDSSVTMPSASKSGYDFSGWENGSNKYTSGSSYKINKNITLVAKFNCNHKTVGSSVGYKVTEYYKADKGQGGNAENDSCKFYRKNECQRCGDMKESTSRSTGVTHADVPGACDTPHSCYEEGQICMNANNQVITHTRTSKYCIRCQYCGRMQNKIYVYNKTAKRYEWRYAYWCGQHADLSDNPRVKCPGVSSSGGTIIIK